MLLNNFEHNFAFEHLHINVIFYFQKADFLSGGGGTRTFRTPPAYALDIDDILTSHILRHFNAKPKDVFMQYYARPHAASGTFDYL